MKLCDLCKKELKQKGERMNANIRKEVLELFGKGYSCREIELKMRAENKQMSFSTAARIIREKINQG